MLQQMVKREKALFSSLNVLNGISSFNWSLVINNCELKLRLNASLGAAAQPSPRHVTYIATIEFHL